jgi:thiol-disulfide isomerase/thioredoxin
MKRVLLIILSLVVLYQCAEKPKTTDAITIGDFSFSSKDIIANQPFTITYNGSGELQESFYQQIVNTTPYAYDVIFENNKATVTVPDSIAVASFHLKVNENYEHNNKQGYQFLVLDKKGESKPDAEASKLIYAMNFGSNYGLNASNKETLKAIEYALEIDPQLTKQWMTWHVHVANEADADKGKTVINDYLKSINQKETLTAKDYESLSELYMRLDNQQKVDSINTIIKDRFPESSLADRILINEFYEAQSLDEKEAIFKTNEARLLNAKYVDYVIENLAILNYNRGNIEQFNYYSNLMKSKVPKASLYNSISWPNAEKGKDLDLTAQLSKQAMELIITEQEILDEKPEYFSVNQYKNNLKFYLGMYTDTHALALFKMGNIKDAIKYQAQAIEDNASPDMYERYIEFLMADEQYSLVVEKGATFIEEGKSTSKLKDYFKEAYNKTDETKDVENVIATLEAKARAKELDVLRNKLLDEEATDFTLYNLDGEAITLSELKGKTVVLDFWATWCGPCIASFPGMQQVVNKYKDDDNVAIFFIDTFEDGEDRIDKVSNFIKDNNYDFNVLIDPTRENSRKHIVADQFEIQGIPTKIIIGPSGNIKFKSVGFNGSAEKTVSEIDAMIEIINQPL